MENMIFGKKPVTMNPLSQLQKISVSEGSGEAKCTPLAKDDASTASTNEKGVSKLLFSLDMNSLRVGNCRVSHLHGKDDTPMLHLHEPHPA